MATEGRDVNTSKLDILIATKPVLRVVTTTVDVVALVLLVIALPSTGTEADNEFNYEGLGEVYAYVPLVAVRGLMMVEVVVPDSIC